jgi:uncharacterized phage protein (TIGR01671 family)
MAFVRTLTVAMMSRPIKFRAWDETDHKMFDVSELQVLAGVLCGIQQDTNRQYVTDKLMQYIGRKDKNGKEIYEGDIVNVWNWNEATRELDTSEIYVIEYARNAAFLLHNNGVWPWIGFDETGRSEYETIGNIYENPELLK